jgi:hypothetical protein
LENQFSLGNALICPKWLGAILRQMFVVITILKIDISQVPLCLHNQQLFAHQLLLVILKPMLTLAPLPFVVTLAPTTWANLIFIGDLAPISPLGRT